MDWALSWRMFPCGTDRDAGSGNAWAGVIAVVATGGLFWVTAAPVDMLLDYLDESSILHQALVAHDAELLFSNVWTLDPGHIGCQLGNG